MSTETQKTLAVDLSGYHIVHVRPCKCSESGFLENYQQFLRGDWYPASILRPKTVFTFDLLDTYHKISLQGKLNLYDFYNAIMQKTDNHGSSKVVVSRSQFIAMVNNSLLSESIGTMRCRGVCDNGGTSRTSNEVGRATQVLWLISLIMGRLPSRAPRAPIQSETYLWGGILIPANLRKLRRLLRQRHGILTVRT